MTSRLDDDFGHSRGFICPVCDEVIPMGQEVEKQLPVSSEHSEPRFAMHHPECEWHTCEGFTC